MDERTLRVLEYEKVKQRLAEQAASSLGKNLALSLSPSARVKTVRAALAETAEARRLLERYGTPPFGGLTDAGPLVARARAGGRLEPDELLRIGDFLRCVRRLRGYLLQGVEDAPLLAQMGETLSQHEDLEKEIGRCIDDNGNVRRTASEQLGRLIDRADVLERRARERMESILRREAERGLLQDPIIVQREGRFCLPVQTNQQSRFHGIIHDRSDSGATVFMEPLEVVEIGNELRQNYLEMTAEVERILRALSAQVGMIAGELEEDLKTAGTLDFITAKGRLAQTMNATEPDLVSEPRLKLHGARHPLLSGNVVPIDVWLGEDFDTLVITGPNTGGKTVTLKTVGLLALMAQSGLHIPADPGSQLTAWPFIYADIGDEQSIEQSLSTFSGHLTQIVKILSRVGAHQRQRSRQGNDAGPERALVLLDEVGAGTDPTEGAALARAILLELHEAGCRTIASTHYNDLKVFAYATDGVENASVQFDVKTLQPTYKLLIGHAGSSNAFEIAQRLGLARSIVRRGREYLSEEQVKFEEVMGQVEQQRRLLHERTREAQTTQRDLDRLKQQYETDLEKLEARRRKAIEDGFSEAETIIREAEERAREIIADLQRQGKQSKVTQQRREELVELRRKVREQQQQAVAPAQQPIEEKPQEPELEEVLLGDPVFVPAFGRDGVVVAVPREGVVAVQVGNLRVETRLQELRPAKEPQNTEGAAIAERMQTRKTYEVPHEIDVRGMTVDEAVLELDKYLDDVVLARFPKVRIVHGKGTGLLRKGIHEFLRKQKQVREFHIADHEEGGEGATEVFL
ncbi:MAG: endonuclease MutS2 [Armatimonadia bacterium]